MRKSSAITLTVLSALMLTACCITAGGCGGGRHHAAPDRTWYDAHGQQVAERWKTDEQGNKVLDAEGHPIPDPEVPHDRYGRPWVYENGTWVPLPPPAGSSSSSYSSSSSSTYHSHPGLWVWGGSGYRSATSSPVYRSGTSVGSSSPASHPSSTSSAPSGSSISRGGFGSTGMGASS